MDLVGLDQVVSRVLGQVIDRLTLRHVFPYDRFDQGRHAGVVQIDPHDPQTESGIERIKEEGSGFGENQATRLDHPIDGIDQFDRAPVFLEIQEGGRLGHQGQ